MIKIVNLITYLLVYFKNKISLNIYFILKVQVCAVIILNRHYYNVTHIFV